MPPKYSCFISYRHPRVGCEKYALQFLKNFSNVLRSYVELELNLSDEDPVYIDEERIKGGHFFNSALQKAVCYSVCMIVIYTPTYFDMQKTYCTREYLAMKRLEGIRMKSLGESTLGLIIPIVLRGVERLPREIRDRRQFYDFSGYSLATSNIFRHRIYDRYVREIAKHIVEVHEKTRNSSKDLYSGCDDHLFPTEQEAISWLNSMGTNNHNSGYPSL